MAGLLQEKMEGVEETRAKPEEVSGGGKPADTKPVHEGIAVPPELQEMFERMVLAGMKVMFSRETHEMALQQIVGQPGPMGERLGKAMAGLMSLLFAESGGSLPPQLLIPVGTELLAQAADFLNEAGETVTSDDLAEAMGTMIETMFQAFGVDPEQLRQAGGAGYERGGLIEQAQQQPQPMGA